MTKYTHNMNCALRGEIEKMAQGVPRKASARRQLMKMVRYLSRSVHGV